MLKLQEPAGLTASGIHSLLLRNFFSLLLLCSLVSWQTAAAQVFTNVAASPTSGTADSTGLLNVTVTGTTKCPFAGDAVYLVELVEGATVLKDATYLVSYDTGGNPVNTPRTINLNIALGVGTHQLKLTAYTDNGLSGDSQIFTVTVSSGALVNGAMFVSQSVPTKVAPGQSFPVSVTLKNSGTTTWTPGGSNPHRLGAQNPTNNNTWGLNRVETNSSVAPGDTHTFSFTVTAPSTSGTYNFQWQMLQEYLEWFGDFAPNVAIQVATVNGASLVSEIVPTIVDPGQEFLVALTLKNSGTSTWTPGGSNPYRLGAQNPKDNYTWGPNRAELDSSVAPGSTHNFVFSLTAPSTPGTYNFQWQMVQEFLEWFGDLPPNVAVQVGTTTPPDPSGPTAVFYSPANGTTFTTPGSTASFQLMAHGTPGASGTFGLVRLYVDGVRNTTVDTSYLQMTLSLPVGTHTLGVEAVDAAGTTGPRNNIRVTVTSTGGAPTATFDTPRDGSYQALDLYSDPSHISVSATGVPAPGASIRQMRLYVDGTLTATSATSPLVPNLSLALGTHTLEVEATDNLGRTGPRSRISVTIASSAGQFASFYNVIPTPLSGMADGFGLLTVTFNGSISEGNGDAITSTEVMEGTAVLLSNRYRVRYDSDGEPISAGAAVPSPVRLGIGTHQLFVRVHTLHGSADTKIFTITVFPSDAVQLSASPSNIRVSGTEKKTVKFTGSGAEPGGTLTKLELFQNAGTGYGSAPVASSIGSASILNFSSSLNLGAGSYAFRLRATDSAGAQTDSPQVFVNVTNSALLGNVSGVRSNATGNPELFGWVCQPGNASGLSYKVLLDAPTQAAGGALLTQGVASVNTETDTASVQTQCGTPNAGHHFVVDLSTYVASYAGRALYVYAQTANGSTNVTLPCADNNCTMPGTLRVGLTRPLNGDQVQYPSPLFMRMLLTASGAYDEVGFMVDGQWVAAAPDGAPGAYSASLSGLAARATPYTVSAKVRQGNMTLQSVANQVLVVSATPTTISLTSPANGATVGLTAQTLSASVTGPAATVNFFVNGSQLAGTASGSGSNWTQTWTPSSAGSYSLFARAYDANANQVSQSATVSVTAAATGTGDTPIPIVLNVPHLGDPDAGTLPGDLSVTPAGAASYTIPIVVPPGTAGVQPELSLTYNSSGTNGLLGLGWKLGGMSLIHRCGKTIAQDGVNARISFTTSDRLCLDGQRLVLVNRPLSDDNYWAAGAEYRTEIDGFVRTTAVGDISVRTFKVEGKDGRIMNFGAGSAAVAAIVTAYSGGSTPPAPAVRGGAQSWALDSVRDRSGNFVTFEYAQDGTTGEHKPSFVRYGGNALKAHGAVEFIYEARPDAWKRYIDETRNDLRSRISKIRTYVGGDLSTTVSGSGTILVREYTLAYEQSPTSGRSQLTSVGVCARNGTFTTLECQPATVFNWGKPDKAAGFVRWGDWTGAPLLTKNSSTSGELHAEYFAFADFENHGLTDVLEKRVAPPFRGAGSSSPTTTVDGLSIGTLRSQYRYFHNTGAGFTQYTYQLNTGAAFAVLDIADFNGDGAPDIVAATGSGSKVCLSPLGSGAPASTVSPLVFTCSDTYKISDADNYEDHPAYLVDVLGDGRSGQYSRIEQNGVAQLCLQATCYDDGDPPAVLVPGYANDGTRQFALANYVGFTQMVDFTGIGKPYDTRFSRPHYTEYAYDNDGTRIYVNRWDNLRPTITMTGFNLPIPLGQPAPTNVPGAMANYSYPTQYASPPPQVARPPYVFDEPYPGAALSADFSGSGYSGLAFGFIELAYDASGQLTYNRSDMTLCLSTGRGLDCGVRQKFSGNNYKAMVNIADFVGDGAPAILSQTVTLDAQKHPNKTGQLEVCRATGDDTTNGTGTADSNMSCEVWPGVTLYTGDHVYFMDLLGTGRTQLVVYHGGYVGPNGQWQEDGRWSVFQAIDRAAAGQALDRIHSVTNGMGTVSSVEYVDALPSGVVSRNGDTDLIGTYPQHIALRTGKIVRTLRVGNGGTLQRTKSYTYADPAVDVAGRGALGFGTVTETDADTGIVTKTRYSHTWPFNEMVRSVLKVAGGVVLSDTANVLSVKSLAHGVGGATEFPYISQSTVIRADIDRSAMGTVTTVNRYEDEYGNLTSQDVTSTGIGKTFQTHTVTSYKNDATNWLIGLPEMLAVTKSDPDFVNPEDLTNSVTRKTNNLYDQTTGLLSTTITEEGAAQYQVQTDFIRTGNSFGLVSEKKQTWYDLQAARTTSRSQTLVYDIRGRYPETTTNALGHSEINGYDPTNGVRTSLRDANLLVTSWTLNGFGRAIIETRPGGNETRSYLKRCVGACRRDAALVQITEHFNGTSRSAVPTLVYSDDLGRPLSTQTFDFTGTAVYADQTYDALGRPERLDQPAYEGVNAQMAWRQQYDVLGRVTSRVTLDEAGSEQPTTTTYKGLTTVLTNPLRQQRTEVRDVLGQLATVTDALNGVTTLAYEPFGNLSKAVDPSGNVSEIVYDRLGHKLKLKDPDLGETTYSPDQFGRALVQQTSEQRNRGDRTDSTYDMLDRMTGRYERDLRSTWIYDTAANGKGQLAEAYTGTTAMKDYRRVHTYDSLGRPSTVTTSLFDGDYMSSPGYDTWGRPVSQTYRRGSDAAKTFGLRYNAFGFLGTVERGSLVLWRVTAQDAAGRMTSVAFGNGLTQTNSYSPASTRLTGAQLIANGNLIRLDEGYQFDAIGNVKVRSQQWSGHGFIEMFGYDELNRLKTSTIGTDTKTINYYLDGRIKNKTGVGSGDYTYSTPGMGSIRPHAVTNIPNIGDFHYDGNGNLLDGAGRTVTWASFDMPKAITKGSFSSTFVYGPEYQRARQDRADGSRIIYAGAQEVETTGGQVTVKTYWPNGIGVEIDRPGKATEMSWTHADRLGSPAALSDEAGNLREELAFDPWGKRRNTVDNSTPDNLDGKTDNKGFTNHEMLDQLDLVHMNGRVYDPLIGRFMSGDPLVQDPSNGQNYNRYSYVLNNPTNLTDPTGFFACAENGAATDSGSSCFGQGSSVKGFIKCDGCDRGSDQGATQDAGKGTRPNAAGMDTANAKVKPGSPTTSANSVVKAGVDGTRNFIDGGYGEKTSQAIANGEYGNAAAYTVAGAIFGAMNVVSFGEAGAIANTTKAVSTELVAGQGGRFAELAGVVGDDLTAHHMPQAALKFTNKADGGAVVMTKAEHAETRTFAFKGGVTKTQDAALSFREVLAKDIRDLRSIVGNRYNEGVKEMIKYYKENFPELMKKKD